MDGGNYGFFFLQIGKTFFGVLGKGMIRRKLDVYGLAAGYINIVPVVVWKKNYRSVLEIKVGMAERFCF